jgi:ADP-ribosyltransferase exoenzyme
LHNVLTGKNFYPVDFEESEKLKFNGPAHSKSKTSPDKVTLDALDSAKEGTIVQFASMVPGGAYYTKKNGFWVNSKDTSSKAKSEEMLNVQSTGHVGNLHFGKKPKSWTPADDKVQVKEPPADAKPLGDRDKAVADEGSFKQHSFNEKSESKLLSAKPEDFDSGIVTSYTGNLAGAVNEHLRETNGSPDDATERLDESMSTLQQDTLLFRGIPPSAFGVTALPRPEQESELKALIGSVKRDYGFMSTSYSSASPPSTNTRVLLKIKAPKGTKALFAQPYSSFGEEQEVLLGRGQQIKVENVTPVSKNGTVQFVVTVRILLPSDPEAVK